MYARFRDALALSTGVYRGIGDMAPASPDTKPDERSGNPPIRFILNWEKAIEAIVLLARARPGIGLFHIAKLLFYADKAHFQAHGRPILGDTYIAMEHGPVPSGVRDLLTNNDFLAPDLLEQCSHAFSVTRDAYPAVEARRDPNMDLFSKSDIGCIEYALDKYGALTLGRLRDLTHRERAWLVAPVNGPIDYLDMIDEDAENREELVEEIEESAAYAVM